MIGPSEPGCDYYVWQKKKNKLIVKARKGGRPADQKRKILRPRGNFKKKIISN